MRPRVLVLNGPNLNMLGSREPALYGTDTLADIESACRAHARTLGLALECAQANGEGDLVTCVHQAHGRVDGLIVNAGAYSHTSIALVDALALVDRPIIEVHLSNIFRREPFRHHSYVSTIARGVICGLGSHGYLLALDALAKLMPRPCDEGTGHGEF